MKAVCLPPKIRDDKEFMVTTKEAEYVYVDSTNCLPRKWRVFTGRSIDEMKQLKISQLTPDGQGNGTATVEDGRVFAWYRNGLRTWNGHNCFVISPVLRGIHLQPIQPFCGHCKKMMNYTVWEPTVLRYCDKCKGCLREECCFFTCLGSCDYDICKRCAEDLVDFAG